MKTKKKPETTYTDYPLCIGKQQQVKLTKIIMIMIIIQF